MPSSVVHNDDKRWQAIFIEYFLYVYGNRQAVDGHGLLPHLSFHLFRFVVRQLAPKIRKMWKTNRAPSPRSMLLTFSKI